MHRLPHLLLLLLPLAACAPVDDADGVVDANGLVVTDGGLYALRVATEPDPVVAGEPVVLGVELYEPDGATPVAGAVLVVTPWMPDMGHGLSEEPVVTEEGGGRYEAALTFTMAGTWDVTLDIDAGGGTDTVVVRLDVG